MFPSGKYCIFPLRYKTGCVKVRMLEITVLGFVALIGSKFLCLFSLVFHGENLGLCFPFAKRKNQNICLHLQTGNSFVMFNPLREEIIMFPWTLLKKAKHLLRKHNLLFLID